MSDKLMDAAVIGQMLSGSSARTGRRFMDQEWPGAIYVVRGRRYIRESDFEAWLASQKIERTAPAEINSVKSMLTKISESVLAKKRQGE